MNIKNIFFVLMGLLGLLGGMSVVGNIIFSQDKPTRTDLDVRNDPQEEVRIDVDRDYSEIVKSFNQQDYQKVINRSHKFLRTYPSSHFGANVLFKIAESYYRLGELPKARAGYQRVVEDYPGSQMAQFASIKLDLLGKVGNESSMDNFLKLETPENGYQKCRDLYEGRDFDLAIKGFESFLMKYPNSDLAPNAQYWLAECYYAKDDFRKAKREFERVLENYPGSRKAPSANRKILMSGQKLAEMDAESKEKIIYDRLYNMYLKKDYSGAISGFRAFIKKYPKSKYVPNAYYWIAESYYAAADYQDGVYKNTLINLRQADKYFNAVIKNFPISGKAIDARTKIKKVEMITFYVKARKAYLAKNYDEAVKNFKIYLNRFPNSYLAANCRYWAGICYFDQKEYRRAMAELKMVQKDYPKHHKAIDAGIKIDEIRKILGESENNLSDFLSNEGEAFNKIRLYWSEREFDKLIKLGEEFLKTYPKGEGVSEIQCLLGESYFKKNNLKRAGYYFDKVLNCGNESIEELAQKRKDEISERLNGKQGSLSTENRELERGVSLCSEGDWEMGLLVLLPLRAKFSTSSDESAVLHYWIGRSYFEQNDFEKAKSYLNRTDSERLEGKEREFCYYCLAEACFRLGDNEAALKVNRKYLQEFRAGAEHYEAMQEMSFRLSEN